MRDVTVILFDDGYASTAIAPIEIFHSAGVLFAALNGGKLKPEFRVTTASITGAAVKPPYGGMALQPQKSIDEIERTDLVIVPTSGIELDVKLDENSALLPWLRKQHAQGAYVAGVCMGAAYLAASGLLDGRTATTHWAVAEDFKRRWPKVNWRAENFVTEDARLLCSGGVCASMDISLYLVEKLCGHEIAVQTAKALLLNMPRTHQTGYAMLPLSPPHDDAKIRELEAYLQQHYRDPVSVEELADRAAMSERTLIRRFKAATGRLPVAYLQAVRMEAAKAMLERESVPVATIAGAVGYDDVAFFRDLFKRATGMAPNEYRARFATLRVRQAETHDLTAV
ncbi:MAG: GlxA family transcriptional regulator [Hyphomonadaceae bacterium]